MKAFPMYSNSKKNRYIMSKELLGQHFKMIQPANSLCSVTKIKEKLENRMNEQNC